MNFVRILMIGGLAAAVPAWAVYAPIPEQDQGKEWTVTVRADVSHDSNIFGAQTGAISSMVYEVAPKIAFNASLTDQTFASASYELTNDYFENRPGSKNLDSHDLAARLAHAFSTETTLDLSDEYSITRNPQSLLSGVTINTDQSYNSNEFNGRFTTSLAPQTGVTVKFRSMNYSYDNAVLGASIDRTENLYGLAGNYDLVPEMKLSAEYRHEDVLYRVSGDNKDKHSDFLLGGFDYSVAKKVTATVRVGAEWRQRDDQQNVTAPYAEMSLKYDYAQGSFISAGYVHTLEETSNVVLYTDTKVNRFFVNVQHALSALFVASGSIDFEPSQLQGVIGSPDRNETTTRLGVALSYIPTKNWTVTAHFDYDHVDSDDPSRGQNRDRVGLGASYAF